MNPNDLRFERAVGADTWPGLTLSTALGLPVLLFRPLWQTPFSPENCKIAEIILELTLRAFDVDTVVWRGAQFGFARIRIWRLLLLIRIVLIVSGVQQPVTFITIGKLRIPISPYVFDLLSSIL